MNISWFEIVAQIINFFIILFILQKLLYKPVMKAMAQRQERIERAQVEADAKMKDATELMDAYDKKIEEIQKEKSEILEEARAQAQEKKDSLLASYQKEAEAKRHAYLKEVEEEKESFTRRLRNSLGEGAVKIAAHILSTLSSKDLEDEVFRAFMAQLQDLKKSIPDFEPSQEGSVQIHSFKDVSQKEKAAIEDALKEQLQNIKELEYETDPSLVLGYALYLQDYTVHTNIKNYLDEIEKEIIKSLDAKG